MSRNPCRTVFCLAGYKAIGYLLKTRCIYICRTRSLYLGGMPSGCDIFSLRSFRSAARLLWLEDDDVANEFQALEQVFVCFRRRSRVLKFNGCVSKALFLGLMIFGDEDRGLRLGESEIGPGLWSRWLGNGMSR